MARVGLPYLRKREVGEKVRVEVMADSMRVGKSTAVKVMADGLRERGYEVQESYEDWMHNPYLQQSYTDPKKNFLESQKWFIRRKHEQIVSGGDSMIFIQDVSPEMDYCYAETNRRLGRMSEKHFGEYHSFFHKLNWEKAPAPTVLVYLSVSDDVLIQRALDSKREFEKVEPEYYLMMKQVNREWLDGSRENKEYRVIVVDTDDFNFAANEKCKQELVQQVLHEVGRV